MPLPGPLSLSRQACPPNAVAVWASRGRTWTASWAALSSQQADAHLGPGSARSGPSPGGVDGPEAPVHGAGLLGRPRKGPRGQEERAEGGASPCRASSAPGCRWRPEGPLRPTLRVALIKVGGYCAWSRCSRMRRRVRGSQAAWSPIQKCGLCVAG